MNCVVGSSRHNIFFDESFDPIRKRLKKTKRSDTVRAIAVLDASKAFAFQNSRKSKQSRKNSYNCSDRNDRGNERLDPKWSNCHQPMFHIDEELVHFISPSLVLPVTQAVSVRQPLWPGLQHLLSLWLRL